MVSNSSRCCAHTTTKQHMGNTHMGKRNLMKFSS
ncbi:hypothetical protein V6Z12_D05G112900 [Gossypium hirsutum]